MSEKNHLIIALDNLLEAIPAIHFKSLKPKEQEHILIEFMKDVLALQNDDLAILGEHWITNIDFTRVCKIALAEYNRAGRPHIMLGAKHVTNHPIK